MPIRFDTSYLNNTVCKEPRGRDLYKTASGHRVKSSPRLAVWHHTASKGYHNQHGTLRYNLVPHVVGGRKVSSSYNYLISFDEGIIYHYVNEEYYVCYGAGDSSYLLDTMRLEDGDLNVLAIHVELDLPGTRNVYASSHQIDAAAQLAVYLSQRWHIPLDKRYHPGHYTIAPNRKTDPVPDYRDEVLQRARDMTSPQPPGTFPVDARFVNAWNESGGVWLPNRLTPGYALSTAFEMQGKVYQVFERGVARLITLDRVEWLLLREAEEIYRFLGR